MITRALRDRVQSGITAHVARHPGAYGVNPNAVTFLALVLAVPACWAIARQQYLWAIGFILLSGAVDLGIYLLVAVQHLHAAGTFRPATV